MTTKIGKVYVKSVEVRTKTGKVGTKIAEVYQKNENVERMLDEVRVMTKKACLNDSKIGTIKQHCTYK